MSADAMTPVAGYMSRSPARPRLVDLAIDAVLLIFSALMWLPLVFLIANAFKTPQELLQWPPTIVPGNRPSRT